MITKKVSICQKAVHLFLNIMICTNKKNQNLTGTNPLLPLSIFTHIIMHRHTLVHLCTALYSPHCSTPASEIDYYDNAIAGEDTEER